jgi:DNA-binding response OmpR family regulator
MQDTVLVVEDEADMVDLLRYNLSKVGFGVLIAKDGFTGLEIARKNRPDVIILDLLLPHIDGYAVCRALKKISETASLPVLILTARGGPNDRIKGFEIGADDYVTKPFSPRELILHIESLLRRSRFSSNNALIEVDAFRIDKDKFEIRLEGRILGLTTIEFRLLTLLIERRGRTQSRESLLFDIWSYQNSVVTRTVDTHIRRLREKLGRHAHQLETVRAEGYRFNALLEPLPAGTITENPRF